MPPLIRFVLVNFGAGAVIGASLALWLVFSGIGPGAVIAESGNALLAGALLVQGFAGIFGLGSLGTALVTIDRD